MREVLTFDSLLLGFVLKVLSELPESPDVEPICVRNLILNTGQIPDGDDRAVVCLGLRDDFVRDSMQQVAMPSLLPVRQLLKCPVCTPSPGLLE